MHTENETENKTREELGETRPLDFTPTFSGGRQEDMGRNAITDTQAPAWTHVLALTLALSCSGCCSDGDVWSFGLTREFYGDASSHRSTPQDQHRDNLAGRQTMPSEFGAVILVLFAAPLLVDVVFLPVAGVHDVMQPILPAKSYDADDTPLRPLPPPPRAR